MRSHPKAEKESLECKRFRSEKKTLTDERYEPDSLSGKTDVGSKCPF